MSNLDSGIIPPNISLPLGSSVVADDLDKAMVWDDERGAYRLLGSDLAKIKKLTRKPTNWAVWANRFLVSIGVLAILGCLAFTVYYFTAQALPSTGSMSNAPMALVNEETSTRAPEPTPEPKAQQPEPVVKAPIEPRAAVPDRAREQEVKRPAIAKVTVDAPETPAVAVEPSKRAEPSPSKPVTPQPPPPTRVQTRPATPEPSKPPAAAEKPTPAPIAKSASFAPEASSSSTPRTWAMRVERNGVYFSGSEKLFRIGEVLPSGERLVDVDEGSATYATDKGIRQIRSNSMR